MFPKTCTGYNISFSKKQVTDYVKFTANKYEMYGVLLMDELRSLKITEKTYYN